MLRDADVLACEDTRRTRKLLTHCEISGAGRLISFHEHNETERIPDLLARVQVGEIVAVVSDAGMPGISDPGSRLVQAAAQANMEVSVVPGPSASLAALVVSGLPTYAFCFEGFLPRKASTRSQRISAVAQDMRTAIIYESPYRVGDTLVDLAGTCGGERRVAVVRELTKIHEHVWRGTLAEAVQAWQDPSNPVPWSKGAKARGEYVLVVQGAPKGLGTDGKSRGKSFSAD